MPFLRSTFVILIFILIFYPGIISAQDEIVENYENSEEETEDTTEYVSQLDIDELRRRIYGEDPEELLSFNLRDSNVSLFLTGSWKGSLQGNFGISRSPTGFAFAAPETPFLFKQEADLTMALWINNRWFLEANFLDDAANNTYRAGYQGHKNEFLQYAGVGNSGLDFPSFPYLDLGGDSPSSFGFYSRMETRALNIHTLFRYDAASREERVFYGTRERTYSYVQPQDSIRAVSFVLPDTNIDSEITVYIEDEKGSLTDSNGRRWRLALSSEYSAGKTQGLLELSIRPVGMVAASYSKISDNRPWLSSMGSYDGVEGDFLYGVRQWFDGIKLESYPQCGGNAQRPGEITIGAVSALVIYEPGTFSPFERQNRYDASSSTSEDAALVSLSSGTQISGYELARLETNAVSADIPLFIAAVSQRGIYELLPQGGFSQRDPQACWPLADKYPQIYLPGVLTLSDDIILRFTNYSGASGYFIGTDVVPGSIQVWRSGIQDANFSYNSSAGEVILNGAVGQNEIIRITYLKRNEETRLGSIAAGIGAVYRNGESPFSAQGALGIRWNLTESKSFTEEGVLSAGTVGFGGKAAWDYDNLKAQITAGLALVQTDTTGLYRAAGMGGNETFLVLQSENAFLSHPPRTNLAAGLMFSNRSDLIYRNYYSGLGSTLMPVTWNGSVISDLNRPYPVKDPLLGDNQLLAAEFSMNSGEWTGYQVPLDLYAGIFSNAVEIEIPYRFYGFSGDNKNLKLIIQIGSLSPKDYAINENIDLVWEEIIFDGGEINTDPAIVRFVLGETDHLKLSDVKSLRIFAVYDGYESIWGRVLIAPPIIRGSSFRPVIYDGNIVSGINDFSAFNQVKAWETTDNGFNNLESTYNEIINRLNTTEGTQRVLKIEWENMQAGYSAGIDGRIGELPLSDYRELSFFVKGPAITNGTLSFIVAPGPDSISATRLESNIPLDAFREGLWSKVTIRYQGSKTGVSVDGTPVQGAAFNYRPVSGQIDKPDGKSGYIAVFINSTNTLADGNFCIDEIILEDPVLVYRMNAGGAVEYRKQGTIIGVNRIPVLSDFQVSNTAESEFRTNDFGISGSFANRTTAEIFVVGTKVQGNLFFTAAKDTFLWSADHNISRNIGPFSFKETFFASPGERTARHNINMAFSSDFFAKFDADAFYEYSRLRQKWNLGMGYRSQKTFIPSVTLNTDALWISKGQIEENDGYGKLWLKTFEPVIPDKGSMADNRRTQAQFVITERTRPVGAVVTLEGNTNFTGANSITYSFTSAFLDVPLTFNRSSFNFRAGRSFKKQLYFYGNDFSDDGRKLVESINDSLHLWGVMPGYSLFSLRLETAMDRSLRDSPSMELAQYTAFNDHFSAMINFPPVYNLFSFILPSRASARLERVLEQKLDTMTDFLNLGIGAGFSAVNMFGSLGYLPLFKFYHNDEFTHNIETAVIFSKENVSWRIQSVVGAGFRGFKGGILNLANSCTLRSEGYWLETFNANWTTPAQKTLLGIFYDWISKTAARQSSWLNLNSLLSGNYEQLRKETLELTFDKTTDYFRWNITAGHESIIRILGRLEFTAFIKLRASEDARREIFIFDAILGTTLRISF
jgi:hypothetical protein